MALGHAATSGRTSTLPGSSPAASRCIVGSNASRCTSSASIRRSSGRAPDASRASAARETVGVVVVRADQGELEHDRAVVVDTRELVPGADEHERARVVELVEGGLGRGARGRSTRTRACTATRPDVPSARAAASSGATTCAAPSRVRALAGAAARAPTTVMSSMPRVRRTASREQADRTSARDEHAVAGHRARDVDRVQRDRGRFGERGGAQRQPARDRQQPSGVPR